MNKYVAALALTFLVASACSNQEPVTQETAAQPEAATPAPKAPAQPVKPITPERIKEIEATGQTGLWSSITEVCVADVKSGIRTNLQWNVKDTGSTRIIVYVVDPSGQERNFAQGGPVGEKETGPWLKPGSTFKIRDYHSKDDRGTVVIGEKSC